MLAGWIQQRLRRFGAAVFHSHFYMHSPISTAQSSDNATRNQRVEISVPRKMNVLKWPGTLMSGKQPYQAIGDEASSDFGSEQHLLGEKSQVSRSKGDRESPWRPTLALILHVSCLTFYTALFFVLSISTQKGCADDQTQVWCKPKMFPMKRWTDGPKLIEASKHRPDQHSGLRSGSSRTRLRTRIPFAGPHGPSWTRPGTT